MYKLTTQDIDNLRRRTRQLCKKYGIVRRERGDYYQIVLLRAIEVGNSREEIPKDFVSRVMRRIIAEKRREEAKFISCADLKDSDTGGLAEIVGEALGHSPEEITLMKAIMYEDSSTDAA